MYLLQIYLLQGVQRTIDNSWAANIVTATVIITVLGFLIKWVMNKFQEELKEVKADNKMLRDSLEKHGEKVEQVDNRSKNIERNYIDRLNAIELKVEKKANETNEHFTEGIRQLTHEKNGNWQKQALQNGEMTNELKNLGLAIREIREKYLK